MRNDGERRIRNLKKECNRKMKQDSYDVTSNSKNKDYTNFTVEKLSNTGSSDRNITSRGGNRQFNTSFKRGKSKGVASKLNSIRNGRLEIEDPDEILSNEFPFNQMNLSARDGIDPKLAKSLYSSKPKHPTTIKIETIREFIKSKITNVYKMPDLDQKMKKVRAGKPPQRGSKLDNIIYSIVSMQMSERKENSRHNSSKRGQSFSNLQLKIKPNMIIQEMQRDKEFLKSTKTTALQQKLIRRNITRKKTITDQDHDEVLDSEFGDKNAKESSKNKYKSIADERNNSMANNLRLDSGINPRKSIILDISIINRGKDETSKSVKNKTSHKVYDIKNKAGNSLFPLIQKRANHPTPNRYGRVFPKRSAHTLKKIIVKKDKRRTVPRVRPSYMQNNIKKTVMNMNNRKSLARTLHRKPVVGRDTPPRRLNVQGEHKRAQDHLSVFERLSQSHLINFNRSDSHCRKCEACRMIKEEIEPYSHLFQKELKPKKKRKKSTNQKFKQYMGITSGAKKKKIPHRTQINGKIEEEDTSEEAKKAKNMKNMFHKKKDSSNSRNDGMKPASNQGQNEEEKNNNVGETAKFGINAKVDTTGVFGNQKASDSTNPQYLDPSYVSKTDATPKAINFGTKKSSVQIKKPMKNLQNNPISKPLTAEKPLFGTSIKDSISRPEGESIDSSKFYCEGESEGSMKDKLSRPASKSDAYKQPVSQSNPSVMAVGMIPTNLDNINEESKSENQLTQDAISEEAKEETKLKQDRLEVEKPEVEGENNSESSQGEGDVDKSDTPSNLPQSDKNGLETQQHKPSVIPVADPSNKEGRPPSSVGEGDQEAVKEAEGEDPQNQNLKGLNAEAEGEDPAEDENDKYTEEFHSKDEDNQEGEEEHQPEKTKKLPNEAEGDDKELSSGAEGETQNEAEGESNLEAEDKENITNEQDPCKEEEGKEEREIEREGEGEGEKEKEKEKEMEGEGDNEAEGEGNQKADGEGETDPENEGESSEEDVEDNDKVDDKSLPNSKENKIKSSIHNDYSEVDSDGEVFELPSNSESFKAGTFIRSSQRCCHDKFKEAELAQILFRTRLMIKHREMSMRQQKKRANPLNIEKKIKRDEDYRPIYPEYPKRKLEQIAKKSKGNTQKRRLKKLNKGL
ncbi:unnamed protein product [Moneuplotes crassus]|uniref:Uncharacterized protein n=1 Tax=Euplotes crassus TaxID=5936 RepID=A0AAD1ULU4_EUPCR|nr:unnamed protein product [Moneuplotes crassus]